MRPKVSSSILTQIAAGRLSDVRSVSRNALVACACGMLLWSIGMVDRSIAAVYTSPATEMPVQLKLALQGFFGKKALEPENDQAVGFALEGKLYFHERLKCIQVCLLLSRRPALDEFESRWQPNLRHPYRDVDLHKASKMLLTPYPITIEDIFTAIEFAELEDSEELERYESDHRYSLSSSYNGFGGGGIISLSFLENFEFSLPIPSTLRLKDWEFHDVLTSLYKSSIMYREQHASCKQLIHSQY